MSTVFPTDFAFFVHMDIGCNTVVGKGGNDITSEENGNHCWNGMRTNLVHIVKVEGKTPMGGHSTRHKP